MSLIYPLSRNSLHRPIQRSRFIPQEDELLKRLVASFGSKDWQRIKEFFPDRTVRQCRDRWNHYLAHPDSMVSPREDGDACPSRPSRSVDGKPHERVWYVVANDSSPQKQWQQSREIDTQLSIDQLFLRRLELDNEMLWTNETHVLCSIFPEVRTVDLDD
jgi:hypothetical protein